MKNVLILTGFFICFALAGCSQPGTPVEFSKACSPEMDGKYIETSGFLNDDGHVFCSNIGGGSVKCGFSFRENPKAEKDMGADIPVGSGADSVDEIKGSYRREDIKIRDNSSNPINLGDKVKLTGKLSVVPGSERCFMTVTKIEKQ